MDSHKVDSLRAHIARGKQFDYPEDRLQALGEQWPKLEKRALPGLGTDLTPAVAEEIVLRLAAALREHNPGWAYPTEVLDAFCLLLGMWTQVKSAGDFASVIASALSKDNEADRVFYPAFEKIVSGEPGQKEATRMENTPNDNKNKTELTKDELYKVNVLAERHARREMKRTGMAEVSEVMKAKGNEQAKQIASANKQSLIGKYRGRILGEMKGMTPEEREAYFKSKGM